MYSAARMRGPYAKIYGWLIYFKEIMCLAQPHDVWSVSEYHGSWAAIQFSEKFKLFLCQVSLLAWKEVVRNISPMAEWHSYLSVFVVLSEIQRLEMIMLIDPLFPPFGHSFINPSIHLVNKFSNSSELDTFLSTQNLKQKTLNFLQISNNLLIKYYCFFHCEIFMAENIIGKIPDIRRLESKANH